MSARTSEANKAIALAWVKEQQLIREGKGTRNWTLEQQQDILNRGKAYSDDGKAFEGHHMKSAEKFPACQCDPDNIQFLSKSEHFAAHGGNFRNSTNGRFNPATGETIDFGANKYEPCEILELGESIMGTSGQKQNIIEIADTSTVVKAVDAKTAAATGSINSAKIRFFGTAKRFTAIAVSSYIRNKKVIDPILKAFVLAAVIVAKESLGRNSVITNRNDTDVDAYSACDSGTGENENITGRSSPSEHIVSPHKQRYNREWRDKKAYLRGKNANAR